MIRNLNQWREIIRAYFAAHPDETLAGQVTAGVLIAAGVCSLAFVAAVMF
jgi:hypothetical protein